MRRLLLVLPMLSLAASQPDAWLRMVEPVMSSAEKSQYRALPEEAQTAFREHFWDDKSITQSDFAARVDYADAAFGSGKRGSGANTDQGRVYLSLGAPNRITNLSSSRSFVPLEIWYYAAAPQVGAGSELRLLFYRKNATSLPRLYSPVLDTVRELLLPQPGTRGSFGPNETVDINVMRERLSARPVENEVLEAAANVSPGIRGEENDAILLRAMSPERALRRAPLRTQVRSRLVTRTANIDVIETPSDLAGVRVDLRWTGDAARQIRIELTDVRGPLYRNDLALSLTQPRHVEYLHRFDLLPGDYTLIVTADGAASPYPLHISAEPVIGSLVRANVTAASGAARPFAFERNQIELADNGASVVLPAPPGSRVSWILRDGRKALWKEESTSDGIAAIRIPPLPSSSKPLLLEASVNGQSRSLSLSLSPDAIANNPISFNTNLTASARWNFLGRQWLRRSASPEARKAFELSLSVSPANPDALVGLARLEASGGNIDLAREHVRQALKKDTRNFDALTTMAYLEAQLQDFPLAASYFRQALTVQDTPAIRRDLANLPK